MREELYKSLNSVHLYAQVVEQIETLIFTGQLEPGDRLPAERELGERFGVSRTVIREAVRSLQEKGLVEIKPGVGTFIHDGMSNNMRRSLERMVMIDKQNGLGNLMQVREILEPEIAMIAAEKATHADIAAMQTAVDKMEASMEDAETFITADHEFHLTLARATKNQVIVNLIDSVVDLLIKQRRHIVTATVDGPKRGQEYHIRILQAVKAHDQEQARQAMIDHLGQIREDSTL